MLIENGRKIMKNLFFYGTLRHVPLLEIVLGRAAADIKFTPEKLQDHAALAVAEGPFPCVVERAGAVTDGLLVEGLTDTDIARLDFYEGSFAYDLRDVVLAGGQTAQVYFPAPGFWTTKAPWDLSEWENDWAALSCFAAREVMDYFGRYTVAQVARMFPMIRTRAAAMVKAAQSKHGAGTLHGAIDVQRIDRAYTNYFALNEYHLRHERFDGSMSDVVERAVFIASDAALVLPYDPVRDRVMLVEQVRMGPIARGDRSVWQFEPIAGRVDPGETPQQAAHREAAEEAGIALQSLEPVAEVYASPGCSTEFFYIYVGLADLPDKATGVAGLDSEDEDIRSHLMSFDDLMAMTDTQQAANSPLVIAAYWLARHRDRLRLAPPKATPNIT
jgi:ADP-ribose pyrophosphatase